MIAARAVTSGRACYRVPAAEVVAETDQACSLVLDIPAGLADVFAYRPGQFLTVRVPLPADGSVARCYSMSSSPHAGEPPAVTVKRMPSGYASNWIADNVTAGSVLDLLPRYDGYVCGPDPYMAVARQALRELGVPAQRVHVERFLSLAENPFEATAGPQGGVAATLSVELDDKVTATSWPASRSP